MIDAAREEDLRTARDARSRSWVTETFSARRVPRMLPFFGAVLPGSGGEVWLQMELGSETDPVRYLVIGPNAVARAWVSVPQGVRIRDVGLDWVVGVHEDEDGVESVRVHTLSGR